MLIAGMVVIFAIPIVCDPLCDFDCRCKKACEEIGWSYAGSRESDESCWCYHESHGTTDVEAKEGCGWTINWILLTTGTILLVLSLWHFGGRAVSWVREIE